MKFYSQNVVKKARELKIDGLATSEITKKLGITRGTLLRWCFDIPSKNPNHLKNLRTKEAIKKRGEKSIDKVRINKVNAKVYASLIYWCEGYKYPDCNCIGFANSDINLIKTFLKLFRTGFNPREEKFRVHLQLHTTHDKKEVTSFWSKALAISESQFRKPTITEPLNKMKRLNYMGTCTIKYYDSILYSEVMGTYEAFFKKIIEK